MQFDAPFSYCVFIRLFPYAFFIFIMIKVMIMVKVCWNCQANPDAVALDMTFR